MKESNKTLAKKKKKKKTHKKVIFANIPFLLFSFSPSINQSKKFFTSLWALLRFLQ